MYKITTLVLKLFGKHTLALFLLFLGTGSALSNAEITICIIDLNAKDNNHYYYLPTPGSLLKCEGFEEIEKATTMQSLYADGWRLIQILPVDFKIDRPPSAAIYFEKIIDPKSKKGKKKRKKKTVNK